MQVSVTSETPEVDRIWLWVCYHKIPSTPYSIYLKGDYVSSRYFDVLALQECVNSTQDSIPRIEALWSPCTMILTEARI